MSRSFSFSRIPVHILLSSTQSNPESLISIRKKKKNITIKLYLHLKDSPIVMGQMMPKSLLMCCISIYPYIIHKHIHII